MMATFSILSPINEKHPHLKVSSVANIIFWRPLLNTRLVIVLFKSYDTPNAMPTRCMCYIPVLMSAVSQRHFRY